MVTSLNIIGSSDKILTNGAVRDVLTDKCSGYSLKGYYEIDIRVSNSTYKECYDELKSIFGEDFEDMLYIVPDRESEFGLVSMEVYDKRTDLRIDLTSDLRLFIKEETYDLTTLKNTINMESPMFLIMSMGTWEQLNLSDIENVDIYNHEVAYYHSYYKVPVAITEFAEPGEIYIVK